MDVDPIVVKTYRIRRSTVERVRQLGAALESYESPLVDTLLCRILDDIAAGRVVRKKPIKFAVEVLDA